MDNGYDAYCLADPHFYESPSAVRGDDVDWEIARGPIPEGWTRSELDDWLVYLPADLRLPKQGWKIHASACLDNAGAVLGVVWEHCVARRIPFKFVRSKQLLLLRNAKYADRGGSGKFVTIYPSEVAELRRILEELAPALEGNAGPYILSDLRIGAGPLHVRYGGFAPRYCIDPAGEIVPAIADPGGELVPDVRGPVFRLPSWVELPDFLSAHLAARSALTVADLPYRIETALHFSNGGGLYSGVDTRNGDTVVLKEARPHAGLDSDGTDAVTRLLRERDLLRRLAGLDAVPAVRDHVMVGEHHFLVLDFVEGDELRSLLAERYPLTATDADAETLAGYTRWALDVDERVEAAVAAIHDRGVVIGDIHPSNIMVRPDGSISLIDFEVASDAAEARRPTLADPGFAPPRGVTGVGVDEHALACLRLFLFLPVTSLLAISRDKARDLGDEVSRLFPVPRDFVGDAVGVITSQGRTTGDQRLRLDPDPAAWPALRASIVAAILASATPQREDRLFPGDVRQFETPDGGLGLAHGAAGVLYALDAAGAGRHPEHEDWLIRRLADPRPGWHLGLYDGLHGVAHVLDRFGHRAQALRLVDICADAIAGHEDRFGLDLVGGLSGIGLSLADLAARTGDAALRDAAWRIATAVADRLGGADSVPETSGGDQPWAGLTRGSSGIALLFIRLHEQSGEPALLDLAATALRQDLRRCVERDGALLVDEGWRLMPYLGDGSVGVGMVLEEYLRHRADERFAAAAGAIRRTASAPFFIEPGLFHGRAGMILHLSRGHLQGEAAADPVVAAQVRRLDWHAVSHRGHVAFPGEQLLRLSMDLASGSAGVLLALAAALDDSPAHLPFLRCTGTGADRGARVRHSTTKGGEPDGRPRSPGHGAEEVHRKGEQRSQQGLQHAQRSEPSPLRLAGG